MNLKKYLAIFITLIGLSYFTVQEASASTTNLNEDDFLSQVKIYDGDNNLIPYSLEELKELFKFGENNSSFENNDLVTPFALQRTYNTGRFGFSNFIYVDNQNSFKNPVDIQINPDGVAKAFTLQIESTTTGVKGETIKFPGGWNGPVHYSLSGLAKSNYTFLFVNNAGIKNFMENVRIIYEY